MIAQDSPDAPSFVGMFHRLADTSGPLVGRHVAVEGFVAALAHHQRRFGAALFVDRRERPFVEQNLAAAGVALPLHDQRGLARPSAIADHRVVAWHDPALETRRPFALRAHARGAFPITLTHHTLSYRDLLHDTFLPLLLARPRSYDSVICSSAPAREALDKLLAHVAERFAAAYGADLRYRGRLDVVPLGVDLDRFAVADRDASRARHDLPPDAFVLLWVGRLSAIDKADLLPLVACFRALSGANPHRALRLVCAGQQRPGERFGDVIADYAARLGVGPAVRVVTDEKDIASLYAAADVFVSPSDNLQESYGLAPVEAMAAGVPQVVADWDGYRDTVVDGETGFLVPTRWARCDADLSEAAFLLDPSLEHLLLAQSVAVDMDATQLAIQRLIDDPALAARLADGSRRRARERFGHARVVALHESLWAELIERARAEGAAPPAPPSYALPAYSAVFAHYPTEMLTDEVGLVLTEAGNGLMQGRVEAPMPYNDDWTYLQVDVIRRCLGGLAEAARRGQVFTLGRIASTIAKNLDAFQARDVVIRHLLWLLKYGFIRTVTPAAGGTDGVLP